MLVEKYYKEQYLKHHGIKNQKWGRRRWQNKDGSLTPAGRLRYANSDANDKSEDIKTKSGTDHSNELAKPTGKNSRRLTRSVKNNTNPDDAGRDLSAKSLRTLETGMFRARTAGSRPETGETSSSSSTSDSSSSSTSTSSSKKKDLNMDEKVKAINAAVGGVKNSTKGLSEVVDTVQDLQRKQKKQDPDIHVMSDAELNAAINRMNLEKKYMDAKYGNEVNIGAEKAKAALATIGSLVGVAGGVVTLLIGINELKNGKKAS